jgi:hypothetical protein
MRGWCPRCDAVRDADSTCPECQAPLVALDDRPPPQVVAERREEASEVGGEVEQPARGRLRVALAVAAVVLVGIAFVAGRSTGGKEAPPAAAAATTTSTTAPPSTELQRTLGWKSRPAGGIGLEAASISRGPVSTGDNGGGEGDNSGLLTLRVTGLEPGRRLLAVKGLRLVDAGGGVFAQPDTIQIGGDQAVPVQQSPQGDRYFVDLGPTPAVDTLDRIEVRDLLLSAASSGGSRLELATPGAWPARPPARAVEPSADGLTIPVTRADGASGEVELRVAGAFVGAGRAVVVLSIPEGAGSDQNLGDFPVTTSLRAGGHLLCSRIQSLGPPNSRVSPLMVIDCPARPAASVTLDLAAGFQSIQIGGTLRA